MKSKFRKALSISNASACAFMVRCKNETLGTDKYRYRHWGLADPAEFHALNPEEPIYFLL